MEVVKVIMAVAVARDESSRGQMHLSAGKNF